MKLMRMFLFCAFSFVSITPSFAVEVANCGASNGHAFYPKIGLGAKSATSGKWTEDGISKGRFTLTLSDEKAFDLLFIDAFGTIVSAANDGGQVIFLGKADNAVSVLVLYQGVSSESYTFFRNIDGIAKMMWTQNKYGTAIPKISAFTATCSYLAF